MLKKAAIFPWGFLSSPCSHFLLLVDNYQLPCPHPVPFLCVLLFLTLFIVRLRFPPGLCFHSPLILLILSHTVTFLKLPFVPCYHCLEHKTCWSLLHVWHRLPLPIRLAYPVQTCIAAWMSLNNLTVCGKLSRRRLVGDLRTKQHTWVLTSCWPRLFITGLMFLTPEHTLALEMLIDSAEFYWETCALCFVQ